MARLVLACGLGNHHGVNLRAPVEALEVEERQQAAHNINHALLVLHHNRKIFVGCRRLVPQFLNKVSGIGIT
jgi:hypothetical protein